MSTVKNNYVVADLRTMLAVAENKVSGEPIFSEDYGETSLFYLGPAQGRYEHATDHPATIQILKGSGIFEMEGKTYTAEPGSLFHLPARMPHAVKADSGGMGLAFLLTIFFAGR